MTGGIYSYGKLTAFELNQSPCPDFVHNSVTTFSALDWVPKLDDILMGTVCIKVASGVVYIVRNKIQFILIYCVTRARASLNTTLQ